MKTNHYARKKRQLKNFSKRLKILLSKDRNSPKITLLINKIKGIAQSLQMNRQQLAKVMGSMALFFGLTLGSTVTAQNFLPPIASQFGLSQNVGSLDFLTFGDLDGDGDFDMLSYQYDDDNPDVYLYFENIGSDIDPLFSESIADPFGLLGSSNLGTVRFPTLVDIDGDGDLDIITSSNNVSNLELTFMENIGSAAAPQFSQEVLSPFGIDQGTAFIEFASFGDIDADGDLDIFIASTFEGQMEQSPVIYYLENIGNASAPAFAARVENPFGLDFGIVSGVDAFVDIDVVDIDDDGDLDIMMNEYYGNFRFLENTGNETSPSFAPFVLNPFNLTISDEEDSIVLGEFVDIDGDGDFDFISTGYLGVYPFYENTLATGIDEVVENESILVFPNPSSDQIEIKTDSQIDKIEIFDVLGNLVIESQNENIVRLTSLNTGIYMVKIFTVDNKVTMKKIEKL